MQQSKSPCSYLVMGFFVLEGYCTSGASKCPLSRKIWDFIIFNGLNVKIPLLNCPFRRKMSEFNTAHVGFETLHPSSFSSKKSCREWYCNKISRFQSKVPEFFRFQSNFLEYFPGFPDRWSTFNNKIIVLLNISTSLQTKVGRLFPF